MVNNSTSAYAGDLSVREAWDLLVQDPKAQMVDVRTAAEWAFVGLPELSELGRDVHRIEWQSYPSMAPNPDFLQETVLAVGPNKDVAVLFLCRSGARSRAAAIALTAAGYSKAFNIVGGFEGDADRARHRGTTNGWKAQGLPWIQS